MKISLENIGKRYRNHWIFRGISASFETGKRYALLGSNGSGKSTLLRIVAGMQQPSKGNLYYHDSSSTVIKPEKLYQLVAYCAPGMDLVEEFSLEEILRFHFSFKKIRPGVDVPQILSLMGLQQARDKMLHECSSGMKQRVKLAQAFFADTPVLLLDEPCSNLDAAGVEMYAAWLKSYSDNRIVVIASNDEREYPHAHQMLHVPDYGA
jgi:ABC-type multidrug transport system ATPase subunit